MKKITAYISTVRVHWLVEALKQLGINEIMVTEFFRPTSQISRMELYCDDSLVTEVRKTVHRLGTTGEIPDHDIIVSEFDPDLPGQIPLGKRISRLQESRVKQLIDVLLKGLRGKLSIAFLVITISILAVGVIVHTRIGTFQDYLNKTSQKTRVLDEAVNQIQQSLLTEMLAAERLHRGDVASSVRDFQVARSDLKEAIEELKEVHTASLSALDSIVVMESRFQSAVGGMFAVIGELATSAPPVNKTRASMLAMTHQEAMKSLEANRFQILEALRTLKKRMDDDSVTLESNVERAVTDIRVSLTLLATLAGLITLVTWLVAERKVARPLQVLVEEAKTIDTGELK